MKIIHAAIALVSIATTIVVACNKNEDNDPPQNEFDRQALLVNVADNIILPAYASFDAALEEMTEAVNHFVLDATPQNLVLMREQWKNAYIEWQKVELFNFGPADEVLLRNYFNIYPTDTTLLLSHVASGNYFLDEISNNKVQGFPALDYLINGLGNTDEEIISRYTSGGQAANLRQYLFSVGSMMNDKFMTVITDWNNSYRSTFTSNLGTGAGSPISLMVNEYIMNFERFVRSGKFAIPAGVMSGTAAPEKVESFYSPELGAQLAKTALQASRDLYLGKSFTSSTTGPGLNSYLEALGQNNPNVATLAANIRDQFTVIENKIDGLGASVYDAIVNNRTQVLELYDEFQTQVRYLKVDMASAIGITITYTDNDGD